MKIFFLIWKSKVFCLNSIEVVKDCCYHNLVCYEIREMPDPKTATNEDIGHFYRDVFEIIDDFEDLVNETRISVENTKHIG